MLKEMDIEHPAAKMMVEIAKATDNEVGDGTTSVVVLSGALLGKAEELIEKDVHSTVIIDGYKQAEQKALETYREIAVKVDPEDKAVLRKVAATAMGSEMVAANRDFLAELAVDAVLAVREMKDGEAKVDIDDVKVEKKTGKNILDTALVQGIVLDKEVAHAGMPKRVMNAKIALIDTALEIEKTEFDARISIKEPDQMKMFLDEEIRMMKKMVEKVKTSGANVVICQKGIDDVVQHFLAQEAMLAVRRAKKSDMEKMAPRLQERG
jgi:chaperonin GroEL (HSP60 family)